MNEFEQAAHEARERRKEAAQWEAWEKLMVNPKFIEFQEWRYREQVIKDSPKTLEAEVAVIGALIMAGSDYPDMVEYAVSILKPHDFFGGLSREVFIAIAKLHNNQKKVDLITVIAYLRSVNKYQHWHPSYLTECVEGCPSSANMKAYIEPVIECSHRRRLIELGQELRFNNDDRDLTAAQIIAQTRAALDVIEAGKVTNLKDLFK